jgi:methyltransferase (TIGR00027 family)
VHRGQASETARRVAAHRLTFPRRETDYGDPTADERLARDVAAGIDATDSPLRAYLQARTQFFDTVVVESIAGGITQIVVGAAGYDGRAWRYRNPGVAWFEVDHPSTQRDKLNRLEALGIDIAEVRFVGADFAVDPLAVPLKQAGLDPGRATLFLLEGVAVYLETATLEAVLREFSDVAGPGSVLAISLSVSTESPDAAERRRQFQTAVARMGEPARSAIKPDQVEGLLSRAGWRPADRAAPENSTQARRAAAGLVVAHPRGG